MVEGGGPLLSRSRAVNLGRDAAMGKANACVILDPLQTPYPASSGGGFN